MKTTLNEIRAKSPCADGWKKLFAYLGKTQADDEPLSIVTILDSNGLDDALWCLRAVQSRDKEIRLYAVWCARQVQHLTTDPRSLGALDIAEAYANGTATKEQLANAWDAAGAAWAAARAAARAAAKAAMDAAMDAARAAARAAAGDAARAAMDAAWAAWAAAWAARAARAAAGDAAWAALDAAWAAARAAARAASDAASDAARAAARAAQEAQEKRLRELCAECEETK